VTYGDNNNGRILGNIVISNGSSFNIKNMLLVEGLKHNLISISLIKRTRWSLRCVIILIFVSTIEKLHFSLCIKLCILKISSKEFHIFIDNTRI